MTMAFRHVALRFVLASACALVGACAAAQTAAAKTALAEGRVADAEQILRQSLNRAPQSAPDLVLLCRVFYAQDRFDEAQNVCEQAAAAAPASSDAQLWLGRVYGARASAAGKSLQAFTLARKVRACFARAVELDSRNVEAMSDLGEYYVSAPLIVGGGLDKARDLAPQLLAQDAVRGHLLLAQIARKDGDAGTAEREVEAAASSGSPSGLIDLALFRRRNGEPDKAVDAVRRSIQANRRRDDSLVDAASVLTEIHREPKLAIAALQSYLTSSGKSDAAPAFKVHLQLADLLRAAGDSGGAQQETALAARLAPDFMKRRSQAAVAGH